MAPRVLLLLTTATYKAAAFLEAARHVGVQVVVGSDRPQALAAGNPVGNLTVDFIDQDAGVRTILEYARTQPLRAIIAADDEGVILAAMASEALALSHNPVHAVRAARDKHLMRMILAQAGLPGPRFGRFRTDEKPAAMARDIGFPCVVKPLSLSASRGVIRADDEMQLRAAVERIERILALRGRAQPPEILVESFIPGIEVAVEGLLSGGDLRVLAIFDKPDPLDGPFFEETLYVTPSRLPGPVQASIEESVGRVAAVLGLREGPVHAEMRVNERGSWILEIAPRSIGGLCARTLRFGDGISLEELILRHAVGLDAKSFDREPRAAGVMMIPIPKPGILKEVRGVDQAREAPGIEEIRIVIPRGERVAPPPEGSRYLGFIFARNATPQRVEVALREAHRLLELEIEAEE